MHSTVNQIFLYLEIFYWYFMSLIDLVPDLIKWGIVAFLTVGIIINIVVEVVVRFQIYYETETNKKSKIQNTPGFRLNKFVDLFFSKKNYEQIYQPIICDMQEEYFEALSAGRPQKARWVCLRGYFSFFSAMLAHVPLSGVQLVKKIWTIVG